MDPLALTLAIGPVLIKAAKLAKLCRDIQDSIPSAPPTLGTIVTECTDVHKVLDEFQNVGRQDLSKLRADAPKIINDVIASVPANCSDVLSSIEKHVEEFENSGGTNTDESDENVLIWKETDWKEDDVQSLLDESMLFRSSLETSLQLLQSENQSWADSGPSTGNQKPDVPMIIEPPSEEPQDDPGVNSSRFSMDSTVSHDFAVNPSRFSVNSINSTISATNFEFDQEALRSPSYRQAFSDRVRGIISRPIRSSADNALLRAVEPLEGERRYYEQSLDVEWEFSISGDTIRSEDTESITSSLQPIESRLSTAETATSRRRTIGYPTDLQHIQHIGFDPATGGYIGLPPEWKRILNAEDELARAQAAAANAATLPPPSSGLVSAPQNPIGRSVATIKLVVVGDSGKLKQGLLITYITNKFPSEYTPHVFDNYAVTVMIGDEPYTLGIWDTTGQEDYDRLRPLSYPQTDVFMILISVSNPTHYENARKKWAPEIKHHCPGVPFLLVGIKDGERFQAEAEGGVLSGFGQTVGNSKEGKRLAREIGAEKYVECELYSMKGVKDVFDEAIVAALEPTIVPKKRRRSRLNLRLLSRIDEDRINI